VLSVNTSRRDLLVSRINEQQMKILEAKEFKLRIDKASEKEEAEFKENFRKETGYELSKDNLKQRLEQVKFSERMDLVKASQESAMDLSQPISKEDFKDYLVKNGSFSETKAETVLPSVHG